MRKLYEVTDIAEIVSWLHELIAGVKVARSNAKFDVDSDSDDPDYVPGLDEFDSDNSDSSDDSEDDSEDDSAHDSAGDSGDDSAHDSAGDSGDDIGVSLSSSFGHARYCVVFMFSLGLSSRCGCFFLPIS